MYSCGTSYLRRSDKSMSSRVSIIPGSEVSVVGCDNSILLSFLHILSVKSQRTRHVIHLVLPALLRGVFQWIFRLYFVILYCRPPDTNQFTASGPQKLQCSLHLTIWKCWIEQQTCGFPALRVSLQERPWLQWQGLILLKALMYFANFMAMCYNVMR